MIRCISRRQAIVRTVAGAAALLGIHSQAAAQSSGCPYCGGSGSWFGNACPFGCALPPATGPTVHPKPSTKGGNARVEVSWSIDEIYPELGRRLNLLRGQLIAVNQRRSRGDASANADFFRIQNEHRTLELRLEKLRRVRTTVIVDSPGATHLPLAPSDTKGHVFYLVRSNPEVYHGRTFHYRMRG